MSKYLASMVLIMVLPGCYEGFKKNDTNPPQSPENPGPPAEKPYAYIFYQPIYLSDEAFGEMACFPNQALVLFRQEEGQLRMTTMYNSLSALTDSIERKDITISREDCGTLFTIESEASNLNPWLGLGGPPANPIKPILHVKHILWWEASQPASIINIPSIWAGWDELMAGGGELINKHHFVVNFQIQGMIFEWQSDLVDSDKDLGSFIRDVDPTEAGIILRNTVIQEDTRRFLSSF